MLDGSIYPKNSLTLFEKQIIMLANKAATLQNVKTKLESMYNSYEGLYPEQEDDQKGTGLHAVPVSVSSPEYLILEEIASELDPQSNFPNILTVVSSIWDDCIEELYFNGDSTDVSAITDEKLTQSELESIFQLILNK